MSYHFYAMMSRMKYINRWGLMNNTKNENISEHSQQVAIIAHCLVLIHNKRFGGSLDADRVVVLAIFHDATEIITGDMPTPIKYYNPDIIEAYKRIEDIAADRLVSLLPDDFKADFEKIIKINDETDAELKKYVKAADKFSALIKCIDEIRMGNDEFAKAKESIETIIHDMNMPEAEVFEKEFLPSFYLPLDEQD
ncbi:MAG: 5'-deoxynucleotidase [Clostridia bacterium]|nr:5'-deoxynucleotidase [Clostridia bacterium]